MDQNNNDEDEKTKSQPQSPDSEKSPKDSELSRQIHFQPPEPNPNPEPTDATPVHTSLHHSLLGPSLLKAGQDKVDQQKVAQLIYDASVVSLPQPPPSFLLSHTIQGSEFFKNEERRDKQLTQKIEKLLARKAALKPSELAEATRRADELLEELEAERDLSQYIVHVDCDAFFASVEELDRPELKLVPMAVGSSVLSTCNYLAREFGVRSGMAGHVAKSKFGSKGRK